MFYDKDLRRRILAVLNKTVKRCVYCRPPHLIDANGNPIPGPAENKDFPPDVSPTDSCCNKWIDDDKGPYYLRPKDDKDPATAWFFQEK